MILFFDTETTGVPRDYRAPVTDLSNWPRVVQIGWAAYEEDGTALSETAHLIRPDGFTIPADAVRVHGITTARARAEGVALSDALTAFSVACRQAATAVAHNVDFDEKVLGAEFLRVGLPDPLSRLPRVCTMRGATPYCRLPGRYGYKWPTLDQLHTCLFGASPEQAHDAASDVRTCARCYFELRRRGVRL